MSSLPKLSRTLEVNNIEVWGYGEELIYDALIKIDPEGDYRILRLDLVNDPKEHLNYIAEQHGLWADAIHLRLEKEVSDFLEEA